MAEVAAVAALDTTQPPPETVASPQPPFSLHMMHP